MQENSVDIRPAHLAIVQKVLHDVLPRDVKVWVFGSRAKWTTKDSSDLDIAIDANRALTRKEEAALSDAFEESDLPYKVDFVDLNTVSTTFREIIERDKVELPSPIKSNWQIYYLEETGRIVTGKTPPTSEKDNFGGNIPFITPTDMKDQKYISETQRYLTEKGQQAVKGSVLPSNSVMVSCIGSDMGKVAINRRQSVSNQQINTIIPNENFDSGFIYYSLKPRKAELQALATSGSAQPILNKGHFSKITIHAPVMVEQKAIAAVLGALDDKIELNRRMNATLEAMARALFKSWFVDFDPVRAKMEGRQPFGMDAATAALFPSRLVPSALGDIPEGWEVDEIGNAVTAIGGSTPSTEKPEYWGGHHAWATPKDLSNLKSPVLLSTERQITDAGVSVISSGLLPAGTVLMSSRAPIGYIAIPEVPVAINQGFIAMVCDKKLSNLYVWLWAHHNLDNIKNHANGSTFQEISKGNFRPLPCIVPEQSVLKKFQETVLPLWQKIVSNEKETVRLEKQRDYLLPKLISGDIRIRDAEKLVEAA